MMDAVEHAVAAPLPEVGVDGRARRQVLGQRPPLAAGRTPFIWDIHGEQVTYDLDEPQGVRNPRSLWEVYQDALAEARDIVAYCRGPNCVLSFEAVAALRGRGFAVRRLVDGYPEWKAAGRPVETARTA